MPTEPQDQDGCAGWARSGILKDIIEGVLGCLPRCEAGTLGCPYLPEQEDALEVEGRERRGELPGREGVVEAGTGTG